MTYKWIITGFCLLAFLGCSKDKTDSSKLYFKDGIWEVEEMSLSYMNTAQEEVRYQCKKCGFLLWYNSKWYRHDLDGLDRYYGEIVVDLNEDIPKAIHLFNWYVKEDDKLYFYRQDALKDTLRVYDFDRRKDNMTLRYEGKNNYMFLFTDYDISTKITEVIKLKRYDFND